LIYLKAAPAIIGSNRWAMWSGGAGSPAAVCPYSRS